MPLRTSALRSLGASDVLSSAGLQLGTKPLEKAQWAGAVDPVGGETLAWLTRTMMTGGTIASSGLTGGVELHTTVTEFFHAEVVHALRAQSVTAAEPTEFYLVNLLSEFTKAPRIDEEPLAIKMAPPERMLAALKEMGIATP